MGERSSRTPSERIGPEVLSAALEILDDEGPDGFTVRAIALRANVAPMAIYNHFDGLNGVLEALWIEGFEVFNEALTFHTNDATDDLHNAALGYRKFALEHPGLYTVMFLGRFRNFLPSSAAIHVAYQSFQTLVSNVERCQKTGWFKDEPALDAAQVIWSACHGYVSLELLGVNFAANPDETFQLLLSTLRDGFS
ncbi:MAG TPA: TetR/AcrR family transcriptional regulator [Acidimicrobiales bacterium]|nr:TetR/AcrR family transcriptional regulator [Acidimicrobiales bacterium]